MMTVAAGLDGSFLTGLLTDLGEAGFAELCRVACTEVAVLADQLRAALATADRMAIVTTARQLEETAIALVGAGLAGNAAQIVTLAERSALGPAIAVHDELAAEVATFLAALASVTAHPKG
jgi:hypothetical protein